MFLIQYSEAQPQVCTEFHAQQVFLPLKYEEYYVLTVFIHTTYRESKPLDLRLCTLCGIL
jgi:hypothetical protein